MLTNRRYALGAALVAFALVAAACGGGDNGGGGGGSNQPIASTMKLGGPPECPTASFCIPGLKKTYDLKFEKFVPLDEGGPQTVAAIKAGKVDIGELFSTDAAIAANNFVVLDDDKDLQAAGNIVPVIRKDADSAGIDDILNTIDAAITTDDITQQVGDVTLSHKDPEDVAKAALANISGVPTSGCQGDLTVGVSGAFAESQIVASMYAQALEAAGCNVDTKLDLGTRAISDQALFSGAIDLKPEYVAYELQALNKKADSSGSAQEVLPRLEAELAKKDVNVLEPTPANDTNAFVVTEATANKFDLQKMSDLAKPAP